MNKKIGFSDGNFYLKENDGSYVLQDKEFYLPLVKNKILDILDKDDFNLRISSIIFAALHDVFKIDKHFVKSPKIVATVFYTDDPLYQELVQIVISNEHYKEKKAKCYERTITSSKKRREFFEKNLYVY